MANVSSLLKSVFKYLWVGFYIVKNNDLVLGPYQGPVACTRISFGKGVCGKAWEEQSSVIVPDVSSFPGHIACSADSKSEIVIPGISEKKVIFVLDIDSAQIDSFDEVDRIYLEKIVKLLTDSSDC
jgi:GAF domain-containing protein